MKTDQTQLFPMEYGTRCDTFGCGESATHMVGRPDSPLNTCHVLCQSCTDSLVESIKEQYDMHEKSVHAPKDDFDESLDAALEEVRTHAELDKVIEDFKIEGIPSRDEEGGKLNERKEAVRKKLSE